jgi:hypothetical protein
MRSDHQSDADLVGMAQVWIGEDRVGAAPVLPACPIPCIMVSARVFSLIAAVPLKIS